MQPPPQHLLHLARRGVYTHSSRSIASMVTVICAADPYGGSLLEAVIEHLTTRPGLQVEDRGVFSNYWQAAHQVAGEVEAAVAAAAAGQRLAVVLRAVVIDSSGQVGWAEDCEGSLRGGVCAGLASSSLVTSACARRWRRPTCVSPAAVAKQPPSHAVCSLHTLFVNRACASWPTSTPTSSQWCAPHPTPLALPAAHVAPTHSASVAAPRLLTRPAGDWGGID